MRRLDRFRRFRGRLPLLSPHPIVTEIDGGLIQAPYHPRRTIEDFELDSFDVDGHEITDRYVCEDHSRMKKGLKEMSNILAREALKTYRDYYGFDIDEGEKSGDYLSCKASASMTKSAKWLYIRLARNALREYRDYSGERYEVVSILKNVVTFQADYYLTFTAAAKAKYDGDVVKTKTFTYFNNNIYAIGLEYDRVFSNR